LSRRELYEFIRYSGFTPSRLRLSFARCDPDIEFFGFTLGRPSIPFFVRGEHDDRDDVGVAIDDGGDSVEQTFCHGVRGVWGSRIDLRVIGNPGAANLGKLVSTSLPARFVAFPAGREKEFPRYRAVWPSLEQI